MRIRLVTLLRFAASPTFAIMAIGSSVGGRADALCAPSGSPLGSMVLMYALMSAFHLSPWLRLFASAHRAAEPALRQQVH